MWLFFSYTIQKKKFTDKQTDKQTDKHNYRKGKNYIPPIYFIPGYNNGTDKQYVAVLLLHTTIHHYQALYQISES